MTKTFLLNSFVKRDLEIEKKYRKYFIKGFRTDQDFPEKR